MSQLFATKSLNQRREEMKGEDRLRRVLGPVQLTSLGVGAVIGAGIFVATGAAAHNVAEKMAVLMQPRCRRGERRVVDWRTQSR